MYKLARWPCQDVQCRKLGDPEGVAGLGALRSAVGPPPGLTDARFERLLARQAEGIAISAPDDAIQIVERSVTLIAPSSVTISDAVACFMAQMVIDTDSVLRYNG